MKTALEQVGKLAAKTRRASERNMVGPTAVPLEVLDAILGLSAGQKAIVEMVDAVVAQVERLARSVEEDLRRRVDTLEGNRDAPDEDHGDAPDLASRVAELERLLGVGAVPDRVTLVRRVEIIEGNIRGALAEIVGPDEDEDDLDLPDGGEGTS